MAIDGAAPTDTRSGLADWLEVLALSRRREAAARADLAGLYDLFDDAGHAAETEPETGEELDGGILEDGRRAFIDEVFEELHYRADVLEGRYPFRIEEKGPDWRLLREPDPRDRETAAARAAYLFCLLASALRDGRIRGGVTGPLERRLPGVFQAIAVEAAAGVLGGESFSFGWPRPDGSGFLPALREASRRLGLGTPLERAPPRSQGREKDAGIDVIAWRGFADRRPGKLVLFGQVASGRNWTGKSVKAETSNFLSWFSQRPTEHSVPAIFIPFPQHHDCTGRDDRAFEAVAADEAWSREQRFGIVVDRLRIVDTAAQRLAARRKTGEADTLEKMSVWIEDAVTAAQAPPPPNTAPASNCA